MPGITYTIRFHRRDRRYGIAEEQEYIVLAEAWESFRLSYFCWIYSAH